VNIICKELFEKCSREDPFVLCTDVIEYINQGLTSNKVNKLKLK
jgi:hypothetical protein